MGNDQHLRWRIRLHGIDTPELLTKDERERTDALACKSLLVDVLTTDDAPSIHLTIMGIDHFGRLLATLHKGTLDVNQYMLQHGPGTVVYRR